jgi:alpha-ketoglutarate-dependent taurine dioxygenase
MHVSPAAGRSPGLDPAYSGLQALLAAMPSPVWLGLGGLEAPVPTTMPLLLVLPSAPDADTVDRLRQHLLGGGRAVVAVTPTSAEWLPVGARVQAEREVLAAPDADDPLVLDPHLRGHGHDSDGLRLDGLVLEADDLVALRTTTGTPLVVAEAEPVMVSVRVGDGTLVVLGSVGALSNRWIAAADNAALVHRALFGRSAPSDDLTTNATRVVRRHRPRSRRGHAGIRTVDNGGDEALLALLPPRSVPVSSTGFVSAAAKAGRLLTEQVHDALCELVDDGAPAGAMLVRGLPVGDVPPTPLSPLSATDKDHVSEFVLLTLARRLGQPVGYAPEHGGDIVQNLLPTPDDASRQVSTSSDAELEFHTETAFHRHKPRYLLLLCLRGDPRAETLLCSIPQVADQLPLGVRQVLREPRFRTGVDESFGPAHTRDGERTLGHLVPVLSGPVDRPTSTFDADLMVGIDDEAQDALECLRQAIRRDHIGVTLRAGDLLVIDNAVAVHGRSSFPARFDGTDRWIQRTFVVTDLAASADERRGRIITTRFA